MKTVCVYHSIDLDGWMSAAIVKYWWQNSPNAIDNNDDKLDFKSYNYGHPIPDLSEYDRIIMVDISFPREIMTSFYDKLIWIDHHISAINENTVAFKSPYFEGVRDVNFAACELTWNHFFPDTKMPQIVRLLGLYDSFRHKGTPEEEIVLEFQYGARQCIKNIEEAFHWLVVSVNKSIEEQLPYVDSILEKGTAIYNYLKTEAQQVYEKGFEIILQERVMGNNNSVERMNRKFICINRERFNPINFGIDYHKDGYDGCASFYFDGKQYNFSLYNDNGEVDCSMIAKQYGGGGHKGAAGFRILANMLSFSTLNMI